MALPGTGGAGHLSAGFAPTRAGSGFPATINGLAGRRAAFLSFRVRQSNRFGSLQGSLAGRTDLDFPWRFVCRIVLLQNFRGSCPVARGHICALLEQRLARR